ncbi:MAG TPA: MerR family transcriptional regulator [Candidatus Limnocylindrales bacterium]|nr:MerR family transcriptional regulator [Candidatus Limnocylindrales bacterium]
MTRIMAPDDRPVYSIGAVARMLDIPAATLRAWEERYTVITPIRSEGSQRLYSRTQVENLRYVKAQIDSGMSAADAHRLLSDMLRSGHLPADDSEPITDARPLVLIAERDPYAADLAEYFLRTEGWDVVVSLDATQATLHFQERSPDIVLVDMLISGGAGFRLINEFAAQHTAEIIAVSAIDSSEEALRSGAAAFMLKPIDPLALVSTMRDLLGTSALVRPTRALRVTS